jgi:hypothetical protein
MKLAAYLGVLAVVLGGSRQAAAQQEPAKDNAVAIGIVGSADELPVLSAGITASYAPRPFFAVGAVLSRFALVLGGDGSEHCQGCLLSGTTLLPFVELRTPFPIPVNLFTRVSLGLAFGNVGSGSDASTKVLTAVRAAAGLEYRIGPVVYPRLTWGADQRICTSEQYW